MCPFNKKKQEIKVEFPKEFSDKISCLVRGIVKSIDSDDWNHHEGRHLNFIERDNFIISLAWKDTVRFGSGVKVTTRNHNFTEEENEVLWEAINKKFPENGFSREMQRIEKQRLEAEASKKYFESLGCPNRLK